MEINIKELIEKAVRELLGNEDLRRSFEKEPVKVLENILKVDLPDDKVNALVDGVRAKLGLDSAADLLKGLGGMLKK